MHHIIPRGIERIKIFKDGTDRKEWLKKYGRFVSVEEDDDTAQILGSKKWPSLLGPKSFTDWVEGKYYDGKTVKRIVPKI